MAETDKACCSLPAITTHDYKPKGTYADLAGLKTYVTGSTTSNKAIVAVYDVFGFCSQTFQGADRIASALDALVLMPDFFRGEPLPDDIFPPDTDEKKKTAGEFMQGKANVPMTVGKLNELVIEAKAKHTNAESWGVYGLCWGGKVAAIASGPDTPFQAAGAAHPGRLAKEDAQALTVPFICLFSKEDGTLELEEEYAKAIQANNKQNVVEKYSTMHHGWMGARAELTDKENAKEFERGYNQLAGFFGKHL